jgi:hypothetical protein
MLGGAAAGRAAAALPDTGTVEVSVHPEQIAWIVRGEILRTLADRGVPTSPEGQGRYRTEFGVTAMRVKYDRVSGGGMFGTEALRRTVILGMKFTVTDRATGVSPMVPEMEESWSDTVRGDDIERIEQPGLEVTRGVVPSSGFFDSVVEPVITIGAIAVAVYLLFTVRS